MGKQWLILFLGLQNHYRWWLHSIKGRLLLRRKVMTNLDSILKSRDIPLPTKIHLVKAMVFPVVMYGCESWTIKKVEHQRIDAFELWCWKRLLRVPCTARRSNQSILKDWISPEYSLERLLLKLKFQYFCHLMWRTNSFEKTLMLERLKEGGEGDDRGWDGWMASLTQLTWVWAELRELVMNRVAWRGAVHGVTKGLTQLSNWTELTELKFNQWCQEISQWILQIWWKKVKGTYVGRSV